MKLHEILLMAVLTTTLKHSEVAAAADNLLCDEMGSSTSPGPRQDEILTCRKRKRKRGSKMAARLARVSEVEDQVLGKQAELLRWEHSTEDGDRAIELSKTIGKMMSFQMVRL